MKKIVLFILALVSCHVVGWAQGVVSNSVKQSEIAPNTSTYYPLPKNLLERPLKNKVSIPTIGLQNDLPAENDNLFQRMPVPGNECATAGAIPVPASIPSCANIGTVAPEVGEAGNSGQISGTGGIGTSSTNTPLPGAGCGFFPGYTPDVWYTFTVPPGAAGFQLNAAIGATSGFFGTTTESGVLVQAYTGSCTSLTALGGCNILLQVATQPPATGLFITADSTSTTYTGLAPGTVIYLRLYTYRVRSGVLQNGVAGSNFVQDNWVIGQLSLNLLPPSPANESCNSCQPLTAQGCNLGAPNEYNNWSGPSAATTATPPGAGVLCGTNSWISVDNPVYFCATASSANPVITVEGISCNGGTPNSVAQFAAFSGCSAITGTASMWSASNFFGCSSGVGSVTLNTVGIAAGQSFIIVVDGNAGDNCVWNFATSGVLPLQMLDFAGRADATKNSLYWLTSNEVSNDYFEVERSSDGTRYELIGMVESKSANTAETNHAYSFADLKPMNGTAYYRLKQVDTDGKATYSQIVPVSRKDGKFAIHKMFPVPAGDAMTLEFESNAAVATTAVLTDAYGRTIQRFELPVSRVGMNYYQVDNLANLTAGMYFLSLDNGTETVVERFVKK